jgi:hypothetical protein
MLGTIAGRARGVKENYLKSFIENLLNCLKLLCYIGARPIKEARRALEIPPIQYDHSH